MSGRGRKRVSDEWLRQVHGLAAALLIFNAAALAYLFFVPVSFDNSTGMRFAAAGAIVSAALATWASGEIYMREAIRMEADHDNESEDPR